MQGQDWSQVALALLRTFNQFEKMKISAKKVVAAFTKMMPAGKCAFLLDRKITPTRCETKRHQKAVL